MGNACLLFKQVISYASAYFFELISVLSLVAICRLLGLLTHSYRLMTGFLRRAGHSLVQIASGGLDLLFPPRCAYCREDLAEPEDYVLICSSCRRRLVPEKWMACRHCGGAICSEGEGSDQCSMCKAPPLLFDTAVTIGGYQADLRHVILLMKYAQHASLATAMGWLLAQHRFSELAGLRADLIVPIPMHWRRRLKRGTNSPEHLARCLGKKLGIPVHSRLLVRCKNTLPQYQLSRNQRFSNVRGAFRVRTAHQIKDARILLVDDVLTTGATCSEIAGILKKAGAAMVAVAVIARAQGKE
jgi:ComF family protein